ncbi:phosphatidylinositol transporter [Trichosporon asahii var. asahii CBS 2479]|uniref:Phosphatidylinositol transfer protein SFH5 n=1 Tax=Trichosporon asahii var. asahii (strain ATCC 90039 / CBS 2479 / JCM 2466 / KCTC 7840 / NBRC 103889/ NCYC 2677 / UAMH 7654) TaxID=1186058 RepID=J8TYY3_TRIAS|nr:phosphatidylinositol transporter [Trichosporon asahii var. asahii CBS 2479]EJT53010.1 phosphatidylinositol transporter [Trichosporon asahii var. asahii CBS 2479]
MTESKTLSADAPVPEATAAAPVAEPAAAAPEPVAAEAPAPASAEPSVTATAVGTDTKSVDKSDKSVADSKPAPSAETKSEELWETPGWPLAADHPLRTFHARLPSILESAGHSQIWGVTLSTSTPAEFSTLIILQKFLRSTAGDLETAAANLEKTLKWRKSFGLDGIEDRSGVKDEDAFKGLGYITVVPSLPEPSVKGAETSVNQIVTWNVYGAVSDIKTTFGDLDAFLRWRVDLMERAMARLDLASATTPIPDYPAPEDPHRLLQVHVYSGLSFLRLPPEVKAASKATIELMGAHYPETLSRKYFVGVPRLMGWVFGFVRMFVSRETARKFNVVSWEEQLQPELGEKEYVPQRFGGSGPELAELQAKTKDM